MGFINQNYSLSYRLVAYMLLFSLFLQSCLNSPIPLVSTNEKHQHKQSSIKEQPLGANLVGHEEVLDRPANTATNKALLVGEDRMQLDQSQKTITGSNTKQQFPNNNKDLVRRSTNQAIKKISSEKITRKTITNISPSQNSFVNEQSNEDTDTP